MGYGLLEFDTPDGFRAVIDEGPSAFLASLKI
jgi:hypothetical protein